MISKQKETFNKSAHERLKKITELDEKVNLNDSIYKYKGPTADEKFNGYDNALDLLDKIREDEIKLADAKNDQKILKSSLGGIKKVNKKHRNKEKKIHYTMLKCFIKQGIVLLIFWWLILNVIWSKISSS